MLNLIEKILHLKRIIVDETQRAIVLYKGELKGILGPGEHIMKNRRNALNVQMFSITSGSVDSAYIKPLFEKFPDVANMHLTEFRTNETEVGILLRDGMLQTALKPSSSMHVWNDAGPWSFECIDVSEDLRVPADLMRRLGEAKMDQANLSSVLTVYLISEGQIGLLYIDGALVEQLSPGVHSYWSVGKAFQMKTIDTRRQSMDVRV